MRAELQHRLGQAYLDFFRGDTGATLVVWRDDGLAEELPVDYFFRTAEQFNSLEQHALRLCRGRVLDWDAGAGSNSLELQFRGCKVASLAASPQAHEVMLERGLLEPRLGDPNGFEDGTFDTVLQLGHGIGIVSDLADLDSYFLRARRLLRPGGQLLINSKDVRLDASPLYKIYQLLNQRTGRYAGEVRLEIEYRGERSAPLRWFHLDLDTVRHHAEKVGMSFAVLEQDSRGGYLARLGCE